MFWGIGVQAVQCVCTVFMFFINLTTLRYTTVQPIEQTVHLFIKATFFTHVAIMVIQFLTFMHDTKLTSVFLQATYHPKLY